MNRIHLLSEAVANQIAAGEVIQRPASVVKELMENAIDAGATRVDVIVKDAGRTLIQVTDDGCGMGPEDALLCFERHATSKISSAEDLFSLQTKGFRGEALASIASIAHVELKTRPEGEALGTRLLFEGAVCRENAPCSCEKGTTFLVRNLFFNVPARRQFLKSDSVEFNHILDEFMRVVLVTPEVAFTLYHNDKQLYNLPKAVLKQRIVNVFGNSYKEKLLPVRQESQVARIEGFIGTPAAARKTKGEQYLFVNQRYFKHPYFHHAITSALEELLPADHHPIYFIYFDVDPSKIDVNIHPTKIEVKFSEEKVIYSFLRAAVRHAIGSFNISSHIEFDEPSPFDFSTVPTGGVPKPPVISYNPDYNPFHSQKRDGAKKGYAIPAGHTPSGVSEPLQQIYASLRDAHSETESVSDTPAQMEMALPEEESSQGKGEVPMFQWCCSHIVTCHESSLLLIDQQAASERILYERIMVQLEKKEPAPMQQLLFPESVTFSPQDAETLRDMLADIRKIGFDMEPFGRNAMIVHGVPSDMTGQPVQKLLEQLLESFKCNLISMRLGRRENLARSLARTMAVRTGTVLSKTEMAAIMHDLFQCSLPSVSPEGRNTFVCLSLSDVRKMGGERR